MRPLSERRPPVGRRLWEGWLAIMARFGEVQTLVLLGLVYALIIGPTGLAASALRSDFLSKRGFGAEGSAWREVDTPPASLERAKNQF